jgi:hypothetical protein
MSAVPNILASAAVSTRQQGPQQFNASNKYRAEWIRFTPDGFRDEPFDVAFTFTVNADGHIYRGFPIQLDDDDPYIWRGFSSSSLLGVGNALLYDPYGTPLFNGLAYNFGGWGFGTFCWPVDEEIYCPPGSVLMHDYQIHNTGGTMSITGCLLGVKRRKEC